MYILCICTIIPSSHNVKTSYWLYKLYGDVRKCVFAHGHTGTPQHDTRSADWVKSFYIDCFGLECFSCGSSLFTDCMGNISLTYYTSFCISCLCPPLYKAACTPGINHFPASLLHEMKEFIMVTVGQCEAFAVIYLGEIDWFINT